MRYYFNKDKRNQIDDLFNLAFEGGYGNSLPQEFRELSIAKVVSPSEENIDRAAANFLDALINISLSNNNIKSLRAIFCNQFMRHMLQFHNQYCFGVKSSDFISYLQEKLTRYIEESIRDKRNNDAAFVEILELFKDHGIHTDYLVDKVDRVEAAMNIQFTDINANDMQIIDTLKNLVGEIKECAHLSSPNKRKKMSIVLANRIQNFIDNRMVCLSQDNPDKATELFDYCINSIKATVVEFGTITLLRSTINLDLSANELKKFICKKLAKAIQVYHLSNDHKYPTLLNSLREYGISIEDQLKLIDTTIEELERELQTAEPKTKAIRPLLSGMIHDQVKASDLIDILREIKDAATHQYTKQSIPALKL